MLPEEVYSIFYVLVKSLYLSASPRLYLFPEIELLHRVMETMQSAVGHPIPTQQPFNHSRTLGTLPHNIYIHTVYMWVSGDRKTTERKSVCIVRKHNHLHPGVQSYTCLYFGWDKLHWGKYKSKSEIHSCRKPESTSVSISIVMDLNWSNKRAKWWRDWPLIAPFLLIPSWASWYKGRTLMKD